MSHKPKKSTTRLPLDLRTELGIPDSKPPPRFQKSRNAFPPSGKRPFDRNGSIFPKGKAGRVSEAESKNRPVAQPTATSSSSQTTSSSRPGSSVKEGKRRQRDDVATLSEADARSKRVKRDNQDSTSHSTAPADARTPLQRLLEQTQKGAKSQRIRPQGAPKTQKSATRSSGRPKTQAEKDEDDEIAWLEAMLGNGGNSKKQKASGRTDETDDMEDDDGLDDLLNDLNQFDAGPDDQASSQDQSSDEEEEEDDDEENEDTGTDSDDVEGFDDELSDGVGSLSPAGESAESPSSLEADVLEAVAEPKTQLASAQPHQDIYGRPTNPSGNTVAPQRYLPPAARAAAAAAAAAPATSTSSDPLADQKLHRTLKGLLNRLGESNLDAILTSLESIYRSHPRAAVSQTLTTLILETIAAGSALVLTDTFVILQASLVAALTKIVGVEFAAGFVQQTIADLLKYHRSDEHSSSGLQAALQAQNDEVDVPGKELLNLAALVAHIYNLQVIACPLVYDLIKLFLGERLVSDAANGADVSRVTTDMRELDVEVLLKVVKTCGPQLRHDDPTSLKEIVALASERASHAESSVRTRFMLEALSDLKNNRQKSLAARNNSTSVQLLSTMKKYLGGMEKKRTVRCREPMRIGLGDLMDAESKGKWWLVGAAWKGHGDSIAEKEPIDITSTRNVSAKDRDAGKQSDEAEQMLALAKRHGMNTPTRREIFATIMSSANYLDAAQAVLNLRLNDTQRREIVRVLLHCSSREKAYNPYYALIGMQIGRDDKSMKITMQFCLWDYLREIGETGVGGKSVTKSSEPDFDNEANESEELRRVKMWNIARTYSWWIAKDALSLNILRTVPFSTVKRRSIRFLEVLFLHLLLSTQCSSPALTLPKAKQTSTSSRQETGSSAPLHQLFSPAYLGTDLTVGLQYFFQRHIDRNVVLEMTGSGTGDAKAERLAKRLTWCIETTKEILSGRGKSSVAAV